MTIDCAKIANYHRGIFHKTFAKKVKLQKLQTAKEIIKKQKVFYKMAK